MTAHIKFIQVSVLHSNQVYNPTCVHAHIGHVGDVDHHSGSVAFHLGEK